MSKNLYFSNSIEAEVSKRVAVFLQKRMNDCLYNQGIGLLAKRKLENSIDRNGRITKVALAEASRVVSGSGRYRGYSDSALSSSLAKPVVPLDYNFFRTVCYILGVDLSKLESDIRLDLTSNKYSTLSYIDRINNVFEGHARVFSIQENEPVLKHLGKYVIDDPDVLSLSEKIRKNLRLEQPNDWHAVLCSDLPSSVEKIDSLSYKSLQYTELQALRQISLEKGLCLPKVLSSNAIWLFENEIGNKEVCFQERGANLSVYSSLFHTIGGALEPPMIWEKRTSGGDITFIQTAIREFQEEVFSNLCSFSEREVYDSSNSNKPRFILVEEVQTGFVQCVFLGLKLPSFFYENRKPNWEGIIHLVDSNGLYDLLSMTEKWTPTGLLHFYCWLAFGAFGFPDLEPISISLLESLLRNFSVGSLQGPKIYTDS